MSNIFMTGVKTIYLEEMLANTLKELKRTNRDSPTFFEKKRRINDINEELKTRKDKK